MQTISRALCPACLGLLLLLPQGANAAPRPPASDTIPVRLAEWSVTAPASANPGRVTFAVTNAGTIPHQFEVEGGRIEKRTPLIQPNETTYLTITLRNGRYELYCPVGNDSHKKLGMVTHLAVGAAGAEKGDADEGSARAPSSHAIAVTGGGPVIQILPGPFPFPDSAAQILPAFGPEEPMLEATEKMGPYSDNVAPATGTFSFRAWDLGAVRDSVDGTAEFTGKDGVRWKLVFDRVQTHDDPHHPRFGGVILGLYYHGNTGVHNPLVPTINSAVALWAIGHLWRNGVLVTDNAQVHVMLLSHTRRGRDFRLACYDCSKNRVDELQLQLTPAKGEPKFDAPGGFLFFNWERSAGHAI